MEDFQVNRGFMIVGVAKWRRWKELPLLIIQPRAQISVASENKTRSPQSKGRMIHPWIKQSNTRVFNSFDVYSCRYGSCSSHDRPWPC